jgi:hypothetical protein
MPKASTIISQLIATLPHLTNLFTEENSVTTLVRSGVTVTATTSAPHGYVTGQFVTITGAKAPVLVTSLTRIDTISSGVVDLTTPHDLTELNEDHDKITITGTTQTEYNVTDLQMLSAVNRFQFTYTVTGSPITPATGTILLWDGKERGYNGTFQITVTSPTTFTYAITGTPYPNPYGTITARTGYRISGAISGSRAQEVYTKQTDKNKLWGFVVVGNSRASKDRLTLNDGITTVRGGGTEGLRQAELQEISFFVFLPIVDEIAGREARDLVEDVKTYLFKSMLRFDPGNALSDQTQYQLVFVESKLATYTDAYIIYEIVFEARTDITDLDCFFPGIDVAFRDISLIIDNSPDELMLLGVNLDDIPY